MNFIFVSLDGRNTSFVSKNINFVCDQCQGTTIVDNLLNSDDVHYMVEALKTLGLDVEEKREEKQAIVKGCAGRFPMGKNRQKEIKLFLGNAGTAMRPLTAALTAAGGTARFGFHIYYVYFSPFFINGHIIVRFYLHTFFLFSVCS